MNHDGQELNTLPVHFQNSSLSTSHQFLWLLGSNILMTCFLPPFQETITTNILTFLVGDPYESLLFNVVHIKLHPCHFHPKERILAWSFQLWSEAETKSGLGWKRDRTEGTVWMQHICEILKYITRKLTCPQKGDHFKRKWIIFKPSILKGVYVSFQGGYLNKCNKNKLPSCKK